MSDNVVANAGSGGSTFRSFSDGTDQWPATIPAYVTGGSAGAWTVQYVQAANGLPVQPMTSATWAATQSGAWNITNITGTISLPTGAATAAKQPALGTAGTASADVITVQGIASMTALKVDGSGVTQPVSGTFWQTTQPVSLASLPALAAGSNVVGAVTQSGAWTIQPGNTANTTPWLMSPRPATSGGLSIERILSAASTNATSVKASAGQVYGMYCHNINASPRFLKLYNKASAPTVGTDTPVMTLPIPGNANGAGFVLPMSMGIALGTGIALAITGAVTDADTTAVAANEVVVNLFYA